MRNNWVALPLDDRRLFQGLWSKGGWARQPRMMGCWRKGTRRDRCSLFHPQGTTEMPSALISQWKSCSRCTVNPPSTETHFIKGKTQRQHLHSLREARFFFFFFKSETNPAHHQKDFLISILMNYRYLNLL